MRQGVGMLYCMVMRKDLSEKDTCRERGGLSGWPQSYREGFQSEGAGKVKTHFFFCTLAGTSPSCWNGKSFLHPKVSLWSGCSTKSEHSKLITTLSYLGCVCRRRLGFHLDKSGIQDLFLPTWHSPLSSYSHQGDGMSEGLALHLSFWKNL